MVLKRNIIFGCDMTKRSFYSSSYQSDWSYSNDYVDLSAIGRHRNWSVLPKAGGQSLRMLCGCTVKYLSLLTWLCYFNFNFLYSLKTKGCTQAHRKYTRETPKQKKKRDKKEVMKTINVQAIIKNYPLKKGMEK